MGDALQDESIGHDLDQHVNNCTYQRHHRWDTQGNDEIGRVEDDLCGGLEQNHVRTQNRCDRDGSVL